MSCPTTKATVIWTSEAEGFLGYKNKFNDITKQEWQNIYKKKK